MSRAEHAANTYYVHPAAEAGPSVLLNLVLVESLAQWSSYAASQGREIRGVLFGKADVDTDGPTVLAVEDCEPLFGDEPPQHGGGLRPVGIVRSDLSGTLLPDDQDREGLRRIIADPNRILLLVKPGPEPTARILPDGAGGAGPFPLERAKLSQDARRTLRVPSMPAAGKATAIVALVAALGGAVFWAARSDAGSSPRRGPASLSVRADGSNYRVSWDPNSAAVRSAGSGVLHVTDAGVDRSIPLDAAQLMAGGTSYAGRAPGAAFRLELPGPAPSAAPDRAAQTEAPSTDVAAASPAEPQDRSAALRGRKTPRAAKHGVRRVADEDTEDETDAPARAAATPSVAVPTTSESDRHVGDPGEARREKPPAPESEADRSAPSRAAAPRHTGYVASVSYRPAPENGLRRKLQKVPGLRSLFKRDDDYQPPRPIHEAKPAVPARVAGSLPASAHVVLEVFLDARGKVSGVEVASPGANDHLIGVATNAVYASSFQAARANGKAVDSRLIASFDFRKSS